MSVDTAPVLNRELTNQTSRPQWLYCVQMRQRHLTRVTVRSNKNILEYGLIRHKLPNDEVCVLLIS
jgi:hypothetical protein